MKPMRLCVTLTTLGFLLVAIAAGMWPSWALASSLPAPRPDVTVEASAAAIGKPAFKPCYSAVRTASVSCFPQLGLPQAAANRTPAGRQCVEATEARAMKVAAREAEFRPPRSAGFA